MIVLDASALVAVLLSTPSGLGVSNLLAGDGSTLHAPALIDVEVTHALRRLVREGEVASSHGDAVIGVLASFPLRRSDHRSLLPRAWQLKNSVSAYDAVYVALAESLDAQLITLDRRLSKSNGHQAKIVYLGN